MLKILFVDDETNLLDGLKRMLRTKRQEWDMTFVQSGQEALACLAQQTFDVILSDLKMPGMNGVELLNKVMVQYPDTIRIILSGQADLELNKRSVMVSHQYLAKPCNAEILKSTIERATTLRDLMLNKNLKASVAKMHRLPSLPSLYEELMAELHSSRASLQKAGDIISKDMSMTAKIMQIVNSAYFGLRNRITNPANAVTYLGMETIKSLVLSIQIFKQFEDSPLSSEFLHSLWDHNLSTGIFSRTIAELENRSPTLVDHAFISGLLHDLGRLILIINYPDKYKTIMHSSHEESTDLIIKEKKIFGSTHAEIGAYLVGLWGFPFQIVEAIYFHHSPLDAISTSFCPLTSVHIADFIHHEMRSTKSDLSGYPFDKKYLADLGILGRMAFYRNQCRRVWEKGFDNE